MYDFTCYDLEYLMIKIQVFFLESTVFNSLLMENEFLLDNGNF